LTGVVQARLGTDYDQAKQYGIERANDSQEIAGDLVTGLESRAGDILADEKHPKDRGSSAPANYEKAF